MVAGLQTPFLLTTEMEGVIRKNKLLLPDQSLTIALSGGQDSIVMWFALLQLKEEWRFALGILYYQHLWQQASFYAFSHLIEIAFLFQEPLFAPVAPFSVPSEEAARQWRYQVGYRASRFYTFQAIALGHTTSDSVETMLISLMRGSRREKLSNLAWSRWGHNPYPTSLPLSLFLRVQQERFGVLESRAMQFKEVLS